MKVTTLMLGPIATNCYVVEPGDGSCIVLDISEEIGKLTAYLEANTLTVSAILLTHGHYDHIGGVARIQKAYQAPVYVHAADAAMLTSEKESMATWLANQPFDPVTKFQTIQDGETISIGSLSFHVLHTPGHTSGSVCYQCENVLFSGDTLFRLSRGRTDFPGGSDADMLQSLKRLYDLPGDYTVYPGHNEATTLQYERDHNPNMRGFR